MLARQWGRIINVSSINALLGAGTAYEGKLVFDGRVRIDGEFTGEIYGEDILVLGRTALGYSIFALAILSWITVVQRIVHVAKNIERDG